MGRYVERERKTRGEEITHNRGLFIINDGEIMRDWKRGLVRDRQGGVVRDMEGGVVRDREREG